MPFEPDIYIFGHGISRVVMLHSINKDVTHYPKLNRITRHWHTERMLRGLTTCYLISSILMACSISSTETHTEHQEELGTTTQTMASIIPITSPTLHATITQTTNCLPSPTSTETQIPFSQGPIIIGYSVAGRELEVYRFGSGSRKLMVVAGMHGGYEWNTIALANQLITLLRGRQDLIPDHVTLFILRSLNPDGEAREYGIHGRTNENGVDLNRNWPTLWRPEWPPDGCWFYLPVSAGPYPTSEPETMALMSFIKSTDIQALINYHSAALGIFPGGQPPDSKSISLAEAVSAVSDYPFPPIDTGCTYTGQLIDWASTNGIAAVDIELTNHRDTDLLQNLNILTTFLNWLP
jgi:hypothetical protein